MDGLFFCLAWGFFKMLAVPPQYIPLNMIGKAISIVTNYSENFTKNLLNKKIFVIKKPTRKKRWFHEFII